MKTRIWIALFILLALMIPASGKASASEGTVTSPENVISAGLNHTCMVTDKVVVGGVACWGDNFVGQLGDDSLIYNRYSPVNVVKEHDSTELLSGVVSVAAGWQHTCALLNTGGVKCWGYNYNGQLGNNSTQTSRAPVDVVGLSGPAHAVVAGWNYTCALLETGSVQCWGANGFGKLGNGDTTDRHVPTDVLGLGGNAVAIAAGQVHTCSVLDTGNVQCWGYNGFGQLGNNSFTNSPSPVYVKDQTGLNLLTDVTAIAAGFNHTCAATTSGAAVCWGRNEYGQLGNDSVIDSPLPVSVLDENDTALGNIGAVATGFSHSCALNTGGTIYCWGANFHGQLGNGQYREEVLPDSHVAVSVTGLSFGNIALAIGQHHSCVKNTGNGARCWGYNYNGQIGDGTNLRSSIPICVSGYCLDPVLPPNQAIQNIIDNQILPLVDDGKLNGGQGNALIVKLHTTLEKLAQDNTNAAVNLLEAFINDVNALVQRGTLTDEEGDALINAANDIINTLLNP